MKILVATYRTQGDRPGDFAFGEDGSLVMLGIVCGSDREDPDGPGACGCGRSWSVLPRLTGITTAEVVDRDMSRDEFVKAIGSYCWYAPAEQMTDIMLAIADEYPVGTVLGIRLHEPYVREAAR